MKFTLSWLRDHLETEASVAELEAALTSVGLEVEGVNNPNEKLAGFYVVEIISISKPYNSYVIFNMLLGI